MRRFRFSRDSNFQARALSRIRFYREFPGNNTYAFLYHQRPFPVHPFPPEKPARKGKALSIVFNRQIPVAVL